MRTGIEGFKGKIHFHMAAPLNAKLKKLLVIEKKNERVSAAAELIDQHIHLNYKFFPCNFIAHDILHDSKEFKKHYDEKDNERFLTYIDKQINRIPEKDMDETFLRESILTMYSNPLINHIVAHND
jgi:hypothetical protein